MPVPSPLKPAPAWVRWWFRVAALYGVAALLLTALTPPETGELFFHGFVGTALAFQLAFWMIGGDPVRHRPLMLAAVLEKLAFVAPAATLATAGPIGGTTGAAAAIDLVLGIGFAIAWRETPRA